MNQLRTMMRLFNAGRRSQQLFQLMGKDRTNRIKTVISMIGIIASAMSTVQKMGIDMKKPAKMVANKFGEGKKQNTSMKSMIPITEFSEEIIKDIENKQK